MELIKPSQISGEIMTLIEEADEKVVIVSPYCKIPANGISSLKNLKI